MMGSLRNAMAAQHDVAILAATPATHGDATYVIRNRVRGHGQGPDLTTAQVLRALKRLERLGRVRRELAGYAVMISWRRSP